MPTLDTLEQQHTALERKHLFAREADALEEEVLTPRPPPSSGHKNLIISSISNLSTAYNLVVINVAHVLIQNQYCGGDSCAAETEIVSTACLVGAILGQLSFGYVGDWLGRSQALRLTMALSILGALLSSFAVPITKDPASIFIFLSVTRFVLGVGVGGVYPLSATIAAESSDKASRGQAASLVFSMQGVANLLVPLVTMACVKLLGEPPLDAMGENGGWAWRVALGLGALPGILLAPFKTTDAARAPSKEPIRVEGVEMGQKGSKTHTTLVPQGNPRTQSPPSLLAVLARRELWGKLLGTAGGWFLFDVTFYGNLLFQPIVLAQVIAVLMRM